MSQSLTFQMILGDEDEVLRHIRSRWFFGRGDGLVVIGLGALGIAVGEILVGAPLGWAFPVTAWWAVYGAVFGFALVWRLGFPMWRRHVRRRAIARLEADGVPHVLHVSCSANDEAFVYGVEGFEKAARWRIISGVVCVGDWWVLIVRTDAFPIPRRAFDGPRAERAFIESISVHLSETARAKSEDLRRLLAMHADEEGGPQDR